MEIKSLADALKYICELEEKVKKLEKGNERISELFYIILGEDRL